MLRKIGLAIAVAVVAAAVQFTGATSAQASPGQGMATVVSLGDSFIAGEGGRFAGQADNPATDRGWGVYGNTVNWTDGWGAHEGGCHRSDSAPVLGLSAAAFQRINIACSGAITSGVWRADHGGVSFKGEQPQASQLAAIAQNNNVKAIVLSIGGNDFGFGDIVHDCVTAYTLTLAPCRNYWDTQTRMRMGDVMGKIRHAIDDIRTTMSAAGYGNADFRLIVQSYPAPIPAKADLRGNNSGCLLYGDDAEWVNRIMVPRLAGAIRQVVRDSNTGAFTNAQFLDISGAFKGHELCNKGAQYSYTARPGREVAEWANWISFLAGTNRMNESAHPNFFGQLALQDCLRMMLDAASTGNFRCANDPGAGQVGLALHPLGTIWNSYGPGQVLSANMSIPAGTCVYAATNNGRLCFQSDGNLVNYRGSTAIWSSGTHVTGGTAVFQGDGNLVVYTSAWQAAWHADSWGNPDSELVLTDSGFVSILNPGGTAIWQTGTSGGGGGAPGGGGPGGPPRHEN
ncbi:hypothetical protein J5X84_08980 [Streptosporangiaceae bacterium NEAU-GS5]|nr:hypothetical protein [Streptosporangiaceae bacterium NEAU-GS5]